MTCLEKYLQENPNTDVDALLEDCCPNITGGIDIEDPEYCESENNECCRQCWGREVPTAELDPEVEQAMVDFLENGLGVAQILDSGERREFSTGAVRDMAEGKGDMVSMPWEALLRLSKHYEAGAKKYARWNFRKGIPVSSFIDSACRHLAKYQCGLDDEDHLAAAAFNILGAMLMENTLPEMQDLPLREGKNTFNYFMEETK